MKIIVAVVRAETPNSSDWNKLSGIHTPHSRAVPIGRPARSPVGRGQPFGPDATWPGGEPGARWPDSVPASVCGGPVEAEVIYQASWPVGVRGNRQRWWHGNQD